MTWLTRQSMSIRFTPYLCKICFNSVFALGLETFSCIYHFSHAFYRPYPSEPAVQLFHCRSHSCCVVHLVTSTTIAVRTSVCQHRYDVINYVLTRLYCTFFCSYAFYRNIFRVDGKCTPLGLNCSSIRWKETAITFMMHHVAAFELHTL
jgi:hypothetical protein